MMEQEESVKGANLMALILIMQIFLFKIFVVLFVGITFSLLVSKRKH